MHVKNEEPEDHSVVVSSSQFHALKYLKFHFLEDIPVT